MMQNNDSNFCYKSAMKDLKKTHSDWTEARSLNYLASDLSLFDLQVMRALKDLADVEGKTVLVAIHQPRSSIFAKFSDLILLSEGGVVYNGPAQDAVQFFEDQGFECPPNYNPAEFLTDLISIDVSSPERQRESE